MRQNRLIGRQVAGRFTIKRFLGEGGMATVFVAEQEGEPREVALKIMNEELSADRTFVKRFQREAKAAARVQHPNSVTFIDYGVADGLSYIAIELLQGDDLYVLLDREGAISQLRAARILVEVCDALSVAHELGIVHRDLKPENVMVIADPSHPNGERVKVLDFGIAKLLSPDTTAPDPRGDRLDPPSGVTRAGTFIGTPSYMSPEQCALQPVDTRADLYTCGVLLFQLVTGRLPFEGQTPLHTATLHIHEAAPRPSAFAPTIDPRLEAVIVKALAKKPAERHQTARHMAAMLRKILPDLPDVRVSTVAKPAGSVRPRGRTRDVAPVSSTPEPETPSAEAPSSQPDTPLITPVRPGTMGGAPARPEPPRPSMQSAPTMTAVEAPGAPPSVVVQAAAAVPRIRPAAGAPAAASSPDPRAGEDEDDEATTDSHDSARTLVRPPNDEETSRPGSPGSPAREVTAVVAPSDDMSARSASLGAPPAPPPPAAPRPAAGRPPAPPPAAAPTVPGLGGPPRPPARTFKPTLKSAGSGAPSAAPAPVVREAAASGSTNGGPSPPAAASDAAHAPKADPAVKKPEIVRVPVGGAGVLGALQLGSGKLATPKAAKAEGARASDPPPPAATKGDAEPAQVKEPATMGGDPPYPPAQPVRPEPSTALPPMPPTTDPMVKGPSEAVADPEPAVPPPSAAEVDADMFESTTKMDVSDVVPSPAFVPTAQTVPLISHELVASVIARGPRPAAGMPAVPPSPAAGAAPPAAQAAPASQAFAPPSAQAYAPASAQGQGPQGYGPPSAQGYGAPSAQGYGAPSAQGYGAPPQPFGGGYPMAAAGEAAYPPAQPAPNAAALPQTPPVYPTSEMQYDAPRSSVARGLLLGFLAGAVLMAIVTALYLFTHP